MHVLSQLLQALRLEANVFHNGQYCGMWAIDTSGTHQMTFHVVTHGHCKLQVGDEWLQLNEGDAVFFPADSQHRVSSVESSSMPVNQEQSVSLESLQDDGTGLVCGYFCHQNPIFEGIAEQLPPYLLVTRANNPAAAAVVDLILQESKSAGQQSNLLLNRLSDCLLYLILRDAQVFDSGVFAALAHPKLGKAIDRIHAEETERASVDALAETAGMSRSAFAEQFKQMVGQTPAEYQTQWRMTNAWRWLADEKVSTLEAALRCGYESEASFSKAFKKVMGVGPGHARKQETLLEATT